MKTIIRNVLLLAVLFLSHDLASQATPSCAGTGTNPSALPDWYTPNWDWQDPTPSNWYGNISTGTLATASPFTHNSNTDDMIKIVNGLDYDPSQGWVLLAKDFGVIGGSNAANATPYFILYNKYKSILRLFLYYGNANPTINSASVILKWNSSINSPIANNSLLTHANEYALANENYPISNNPEKHINYLNQVSNSGAWGVTEYLVNFDPNTLKNINNFQHIDFDFKLSTISEISINGEFKFSTESATAKSPPQAVVNGSNPNLLDYVVDGKTALAKAPLKSELKEGFDKIANKVSDIDEKFCNNFTRDLSNLNNSLQNGKLKDYLLGGASLLEEAGGFLGTVGTVLDLFINKSNSAVATNTETFIQPTVSQGDMVLTGTIVTQSNPLKISLQLPGTSHKHSSGLVNCPNLPIYDCPLGVISLQEAPGIEVRTWNEPVKAGSYHCSIDFYPNTGAGCSAPVAQFNQSVLSSFPNGATFFRRSSSCAVTFPNKTIKSYKVTGDIKLALNDAAGVVVESAKAALVFEIKKVNNAPAFNLLQSDTVTPPSCCNPLSLLPNTCAFVLNGAEPNVATSINNEYFNPQNNFVESSPFNNRAKRLLNAGHLRLSNYDSIGGLHKFQTPFIDITKFKNTAVTIEDGCNVYLKLLITLRPINPSHDQTPIVQVVTYQIPAGKFSTNNAAVSYVMTCDQRLEEDTTLVGPANAIGSLADETISSYAIRTAANSTLFAQPNTLTHLKAFASIKLKPSFKTDVQGNAVFRASLNPNILGCETATNALVLQAHTFSCQNNAANNRVAYSGEEADHEQPTNAEKLQRIRLQIAPNPNNGNFTLLFNEQVGVGSVKLYNSMSQEVYSQALEEKADRYELNLNGQLEPGAYYLSWNNAIFVINRKFIVN